MLRQYTAHVFTYGNPLREPATQVVFAVKKRASRLDNPLILAANVCEVLGLERDEVYQSVPKEWRKVLADKNEDTGTTIEAHMVSLPGAVHLCAMIEDKAKASAFAVWLAEKENHLKFEKGG